MKFIPLTYLTGCFFFLLVIPFNEIQAQKELREANRLFESAQYCESIPYYSKYLNAFVDKNALVKRGRAYYHCNQLTEAIEDYQNAQILDYKEADLDYYLARAYHQNQAFNAAIEYYKKYLSKNLKNEYIRQGINEEIKRCTSGIELHYQTSGASIENFGPSVNSTGNEINMIQSPNNPSRYYFSKSESDQPSQYHIMFYTLREASWLEAEELNKDQSNYNQVVAGVSPDGKLMYFSRYDEKTGKNRLFTDVYVKGESPFSNIRFFEGPIKYELGDRDLYIVDDSTFLFSSNRLGGYGGYDLFVTGYQNGFWYEPINLGKRINTAFDEITPSTDPEFGTLYFSSNNTESMGGFDVFKAHYLPAELTWSEPENLAFPCNSPGNDFNFKFINQGQQSLITSDRKSDGLGGFDIYQLTFDRVEKKPYYEGVSTFLANCDLKLAYKRFGVKSLHYELTRTDSIETDTLSPTPPIPELASKFEKSILKSAENTTNVPSGLANKTVKNKSLLVVKPLFYDNENALLENETQKTYIESIIETLVKNPSFNIKITGHCAPGQNAWEDLHLTIEKLLPIVKFMADEGVAPDHIFISSAGSNLPVAKENVNERLKPASKRYNNRIQFQLFNIGNMQVEYESPFVVQHLRNNDWYLYRSIEQGLAYKIQLEISDETTYEKLSEIVGFCVVDMDIFTTKKKYNFGIFTRYEEAKKTLEMIYQETGLEAEISAYVAGDPVDETNVLDFAKKYTDLINFMEDNDR